MKIRELNAILISPILKTTGFRFDKSYRQADTGWKAFVFAYILNTTGANIRANGSQ